MTNSEFHRSAGSGDATEAVRAKEYIDKSIHSFTHDPPGNDFQRGFLAALEIVRKEAFDVR